MVGPSKGRPPMSHRKTDLGIPRRSKSAKVVLGAPGVEDLQALVIKVPHVARGQHRILRERNASDHRVSKIDDSPCSPPLRHESRRNLGSASVKIQDSILQVISQQVLELHLSLG